MQQTEGMARTHPALQQAKKAEIRPGGLLPGIRFLVFFRLLRSAVVKGNRFIRDGA